MRAEILELKMAVFHLQAHTHTHTPNKQTKKVLVHCEVKFDLWVGMIPTKEISGCSVSIDGEQRERVRYLSYNNLVCNNCFVSNYLKLSFQDSLLLTVHKFKVATV